MNETEPKRKSKTIGVACHVGPGPSRLCSAEAAAIIGQGVVVPGEKPKSLVDELVDDFSDLLLLQKKANINDEYLGKRIELQKRLKEQAEELQKTRRGRRHIKAVTNRKSTNSIKNIFRAKPKKDDE